MKKNRILSSLLCLSLAAGLLIPGLPAYAEGEGESGSNSGMKLSKTAVANDNGTYTITLEAYATGEKVISQVDKYVPTDIVLVLDQSGSMEESMTSVNFTPYKDKRNSEHYKNRHNGGGNNLHYWDESTGAYYEVSVNVTEIKTYKALGSLKNYTTSWGQVSDQCYWYYNDNLYEKVGEEYKPVTLSSDWIQSGWGGYFQFTYTFSDGTSITSNGLDETPDFGSHGPLYTMTVDESQTIYTYTYKDAEGNIQTIGTSTGASTEFDITLFKKGTDTSKSRLEALRTAVTTFADSVAKKAAGADGQLGTEDDINHRVAVVGFASKSGNGNNTELLSIAGRNSGSVGIAYNSINNDPNNLKKVLQDMRTTDGRSMVTKAINALAAEGATEIDLGMDMAQRILAANPVPSGEKRNRVVVVFTDGSPTTSNGFEMAVANRAITKANSIKADGAKVYAVGIFGGADPTTAGKSNGTTTEKSNWFMQNLSSNNGTVSIPGCYLSASDSTTLNSIFEKLADNIESGGATTTLGESAVIKDIISPQFTLPEGTTFNDITLETWHCTGKTGDAYTWSKNKDAMGAKASVDVDKVNVTGFDFAGNYVGPVTQNGTTTYRGNKLVISFTVSPKAGFLGGNDVYTNTSAGVYENSNADTPVLVFEKPQVNVPIKDVNVTAADKDVYLLANVTAAQLKDGAAVKVGDVTLDFSKENYGLQDWQNEYVNITVEIKDKDGNPISDKLENLTEDTTYTVKVTVEPKTVGTSTTEKGDAATAKTGANNPAANINVYKPELTYKDSEVFYGDDAPTDAELADNLALTQWKHGDDVAVPANMVGTAPDLTVTYTTEDGLIADGKINSKKDIPVAATVNIGDTDVTDYTIFAHEDCNPACGWDTTVTPNGNPAFLLHVKTASLTIEKAGNVGDTEGFIFNVDKVDDANTSFRVSVQGKGQVTITGLPLGTYTVTEETDWSWRYKGGVSVSDSSVTLTDSDYTAVVTVTNTRTNDYLLDGNAYKQNNSVQYAGN